MSYYDEHGQRSSSRLRDYAERNAERNAELNANRNGVAIRQSRRLRELQFPMPAINRFVELMDADFFGEHIAPHLSQASFVNAMHAFPQLHVNPWDYRAIIGRIPARLIRNPDA